MLASLLPALASHAWQLAAMGFLLIGSAFFSGSETALFSLTLGQRHAVAKRPGGRFVVALLKRPSRTLNMLLLGNMLVNVAYSATAAMIVLTLRSHGAAAWQVTIVSICGLMALILLGEVAPKVLALAAAERWSLLAGGILAGAAKALAGPLWLLDALLIRPVVRLLHPRTRDTDRPITPRDLSVLLDLSAQEGFIASDHHDLLSEILTLGELTVSNIMVPRVDVIDFDIEQPPGELASLLRQGRLEYVPLVHGDLDHVEGIILTRRFLQAPHAPIIDHTFAPTYIPETAPVERALLTLSQSDHRVAMVVDEYGGIAGMLCLEDILEELVGHLPREAHDSDEPLVRQVTDDTYVIDAHLPIHEWVNAFGIELPQERISTIGGFVTATLGHIPDPGEHVTWRNLTFTVVSMQRRRVDKLQVTVGQEEAS
jgi:putative hemolysin